MEGRINIYVAPSGDQTDISVNARFLFSIHLTYQGMNQYEIPMGPSASEEFVIDFNTNKPSKFDGIHVGCKSNGTLEERILDAAR